MPRRGVGGEDGAERGQAGGVGEEQLGVGTGLLGGVAGDDCRRAGSWDGVFVGVRPFGPTVVGWLPSRMTAGCWFPWTTAWRRCRGVPIATLAEEPLLFAEEQRAPEFNRFAIDAAEPALASRVRTLEVLRMLEQLRRRWSVRTLPSSSLEWTAISPVPLGTR